MLRINKKSIVMNIFFVVPFFLAGFFLVNVSYTSASETECRNSGGTYVSSGEGYCSCPSGTAINDVCFLDPNPTPNPNSGTGNPTPNPNSGAGTCPEGRICNPLQSQSIEEFLLKIIDVLLLFALPIIILYIMYAGFLFVTAAGNSEKVTSAKNALLWSVVGGVIALGAKLIIEVIQGTVTAF